MDVLMPQLGETVAEGKIIKWFKSVGDKVAPGDNLFEIETDKVTVEIPAIVGGVLAAINVGEGTVAPVGAVLAVVSDGSAAAQPAAPVPPRRPPAAAARGTSGRRVRRRRSRARSARGRELDLSARCRRRCGISARRGAQRHPRDAARPPARRRGRHRSRRDHRLGAARPHRRQGRRDGDPGAARLPRRRSPAPRPSTR